MKTLISILILVASVMAIEGNAQTSVVITGSKVTVTMETPVQLKKIVDMTIKARQSSSFYFEDGTSVSSFEVYYENSTYSLYKVAEEEEGGKKLLLTSTKVTDIRNHLSEYFE